MRAKQADLYPSEFHACRKIGRKSARAALSARRSPWIKRRLKHRAFRIKTSSCIIRDARQFASVERETGVESGRAATLVPDRYNKWDNDITGAPGSRARPGPNVVIIAFGSPAPCVSSREDCATLPTARRRSRREIITPMDGETGRLRASTSTRWQCNSRVPLRGRNREKLPPPLKRAPSLDGIEL